MRHTIPMTRTEAKLLVDEFCYEYDAIMTGLQHRYIVEALCGEPISMADAGRMSGRTFAVIALAIICATRCGEKVCVVSSNVISAQLSFEQLVKTLQACNDRNTRQLIKVRGSSRSIYVNGGFCSGGEITVAPCTGRVRPGMRYDRALIDADGNQYALELAEAYASKIV